MEVVGEILLKSTQTGDGRIGGLGSSIVSEVRSTVSWQAINK